MCARATPSARGIEKSTTTASTDPLWRAPRASATLAATEVLNPLVASADETTCWTPTESSTMRTRAEGNAGDSIVASRCFSARRVVSTRSTTWSPPRRAAPVTTSASASARTAPSSFAAIRRTPTTSSTPRATGPAALVAMTIDVGTASERCPIKSANDANGTSPSGRSRTVV